MNKIKEVNGLLVSESIKPRLILLAEDIQLKYDSNGKRIKHRRFIEVITDMGDVFIIHIPKHVNSMSVLEIKEYVDRKMENKGVKSYDFKPYFRKEIIALYPSLKESLKYRCINKSK